MLNQLDKLLKRIPSCEKLFYALKGTGASSHIWLERQRRDPYVRRAVKESYRARSAFKLIELDQKYNFLKPGHVVIDIGAAPGSWSQVAVKKTNADGRDSNKPKGLVISIDRSDYIEPIEGAVIFDNTDITDSKTIDKVRSVLNNRLAHSVISDMAPNCTGIGTMDHDNIIILQRKAFELAKQFLNEQGYFVCKLFSGDSVSEFQRELLKNFSQVKVVKPAASRDESAEIFLFCSKFNKH